MRSKRDKGEKERDKGEKSGVREEEEWDKG